MIYAERFHARRESQPKWPCSDDQKVCFLIPWYALFYVLDGFDLRTPKAGNDKL